jgi:hypothetical protein
MASQLLKTDFEWPVPRAGFAWVDLPVPAAAKQSRSTGQAVNLESLREPYLVPIVPPGALAGDQNYRPLDRTGLFRILADTPATQEGILEFAKEFGRLGGSVTASNSPPPSANPHFWWHSESLSSWRSEIEQMKEAVGLWDLCRAGDRKALSDLIHWEPHFLCYVPPKSQFRTTVQNLVIASEDSLGDPIGDYDRGDVVIPAWKALLWIVNCKLNQHPAPRQLLWDRRTLRPISQLVPSSLISAMWIQLAQAITENKNYDQCHQCGLWFEVAAEKRKDAKFCSNACRFKAYRERQKLAKRLHAEGMVLVQIASKLGSDVETVKGWVK